MRGRGWRFNGQQYPNALHMAVTRPQTQPGVAEAFAADLADAVAYARRARRRARPQSGAIYGGVAGGMTDEADEFISTVMADMMDAQQADPRRRLSAGLGPTRDPPSDRRSAARSSSPWPSTSAPAARRSGWSRSPARSPGRAPCAVPTRRPADGGATQDAAQWWRLVIATPAGGRWRLRGGRAPARSWRSRAPGSGPARSRSTRAGVRSATACCGSDTRGGPTSAGRVGGPVAGYAPVAAGPLDPPQRRGAVDLRRRSRSATSSSSSTSEPEVARRHPLVPRARRLPLDALHRSRRGHARLDDRRVAHRQPPSRASRLRPGAGRPVGRPGGQAPPAAADRLGRSAPCCPRSPPTSASAPGIAGRGRHPRPPLGRGRRRRRARPTRPTWRSAPPAGSAARSRARRPTRSARSPTVPGFRRRATWSPTTRRPAGAASSGSRDDCAGRRRRTTPTTS